MAKSNYRDEDEYGNKLTLYRPAKKGRDKTLHLEIENTDFLGNPIVTCMNLDFVAASELAETLIRYAMKLALPDFDEACCEDDCCCKQEEPVEPVPEGTNAMAIAVPSCRAVPVTPLAAEAAVPSSPFSVQPEMSTGAPLRL